MKIGKIRFGKTKQIQKINYKDMDKFKYDKNTDIIPKKRNRLICIFFSENKGCHFILRKMNNRLENDYFKYNNGMYIIDNESIHLTSNGSRIAFYLEGISTPIKMSNIPYEEVNIPYVDLYGNTRDDNIVRKIKGLDFDSKILNTFANRKFAELFTRTPVKGLEFILLILSVVCLVMVGISYGVTYAFR